MKKIICLSLALCLILTLTACGAAESSSKKGSSDKKTSSTASASEKEENTESKPEEEVDNSPKVGDLLTEPEATVDFDTCPAFYVDYLQTTAGTDYNFILATEQKGDTRTLYLSDKTVGDEHIYVLSAGKISYYYRETADADFTAGFSGDAASDEGKEYMETYEISLLQIKRFLNPAEEGYSFVKMQDTSTKFGPCFVYNQITDKTADGYVLIDKDAGIMVSSESHKKGDHTMTVQDFSFKTGMIPHVS